MIARALRVVRTVGRRIAARFASTGVVLLYHRIAPAAEDDPDPFRLRVSPERFAEQLAVLRDLAEPAPLDALAREPAGKVAVTFDDAYHDVLAHGAPALAAAGVPATVFALDGAGPFWWDRLTWAALGGERVEGACTVRVGERDVRLPDLSDRRALLRAVHRLARGLEGGARDALVEQVRGFTGAPETGPGDRVRPMTAEELRDWASRPGLAVGSHTASHRPLAGLPAADQRREIVEHRARLAASIGVEPAAFAYPYGLDTDFDRTSVALAREAGYVCACTAEMGAVTANADRFRLARLWVEDWDGDTFRRRIAPWLGG